MNGNMKILIISPPPILLKFRYPQSGLCRVRILPKDPKNSKKLNLAGIPRSRQVPEAIA